MYRSSLALLNACAEFAIATAVKRTRFSPVSAVHFQCSQETTRANAAIKTMKNVEACDATMTCTPREQDGVSIQHTKGRCSPEQVPTVFE